MLVKNEINKKKYEKLMNYVMNKADAVMFVYRKDGFNEKEVSVLSNTFEKVNKKLNLEFLKKRHGSHWVFSKVGNEQLGITDFHDPINFSDLFSIVFYRTTERVYNYIMSNDNLYSWLNPLFPEDISFFKDGYCWLYSVSHEELCCIYPNSKEEYEYLRSIGIEFYEDDFILTPREQLYYEDYKENLK